MIPALQALKILNDLLITTQTDPNSITPDMVGGITDDLIDIIEPLLEIEINRQYSGGSTPPSDLDGADGDVYFYADGSDTVEVFQKISGTWESKGSFVIANGPDPLSFTNSDLIGSSGDYHLDFTPTTGFIPVYTQIILTDTSGYNNPAVYTKAIGGIYSQYGFSDNSAQTIKIYLIKA